MTETIDYLRSPTTIRERCDKILSLGIEGHLTHFSVDLSKLAETVAAVIEVTKASYPSLEVPYHSRWQHFNSSHRNRLKEFRNSIKDLPHEEQGARLYELVIVSVLLDAGAGMPWRYKSGDEVFSKSEGLAIASFDMFTSGLFSEDGSAKVDAKTLVTITPEQLANSFQVSPANPLVGVEGRCGLLQDLGKQIQTIPQIFGTPGRLGNLYTFLSSKAANQEIKASSILKAVLEGLGGIWPETTVVDGVNLGDVWRHSSLENEPIAPGLVPFHKLSQWLSYSLVEPLEWSGHTVTGLDDLTGLPEYRNGGLLVDTGVLSLKSKTAVSQSHKPDSELIIEWRALTVALLDRIGDLVRNELGMDSSTFPLAKVLQGGTWAAGRIIAKEKRSDGGPPINIESNGTVF